MALLCLVALQTFGLLGWPGVLFLLAYLKASANILCCFRLNNKLGKGAGDWMGESIAARNELPPDKPVAS
jgi:hypothetical protein